LQAANLAPLSCRLAFEYVARSRNPNTGGKHMGDKSPKAKDKNKKQDTAAKDQKKTNASNKAGAVNAASKKGK
jgi:hypothetical protein